MDQEITSRPSLNIAVDSVLCSMETQEDLQAAIQNPEVLSQIGFTGIVTTESLDRWPDALENLGLTAIHSTAFDRTADFAGWVDGPSPSASQVWQLVSTDVEATIIPTVHETTLLDRSKIEVTMLLQMAIAPIPIVPLHHSILHSSSFRQHRELMRSTVFWRKRFGIARHRPRLVHAGDDGLLIFTIDSWLVALNQNPEEAAIDVGSQGAMWLMLGTQHDVHLHGSMLILPSFSGAILANELAR